MLKSPGHLTPQTENAALVRRLAMMNAIFSFYFLLFLLFLLETIRYIINKYFNFLFS